MIDQIFHMIYFPYSLNSFMFGAPTDLHAGNMVWFVDRYARGQYGLVHRPICTQTINLHAGNHWEQLHKRQFPFVSAVPSTFPKFRTRLIQEQKIFAYRKI